jgi:hypothetical protein
MQKKMLMTTAHDTAPEHCLWFGRRRGVCVENNNLLSIQVSGTRGIFRYFQEFSHSLSETKHIYAPKHEIIDIHDKELPVYAIKYVLIIIVITFW